MTRVGPPPDALLAGSERFEEVKFLGKGAFGTVVLAREFVDITGEPVSPPRNVAIKFIPRGDKYITHNVTREIKNHRPLFHPHVIQFREVILTDSHLGIVLEYAPGKDLLSYVKSHGGKLSEGRARWFFQQFVIAIDYCHRHKVVNRDIKLENTLLDREDDKLAGLPAPLIKVTDFGLSKHEAAQGQPVSFVGTPAYMAPEVIEAVKPKEYDGKEADVWSSGVMLYAMLTGRLPFTPRTGDPKGPEGMNKLFQRILNAEYDPPQEVSAGCRNLLTKIFVKDPAQRITIQGIYDDPWFKTDLPPTAPSMNNNFGLNHQLLQTEQQIDALIDRARRPLLDPNDEAHINEYVDQELQGLNMHDA